MIRIQPTATLKKLVTLWCLLLLCGASAVAQESSGDAPKSAQGDEFRIYAPSRETGSLIIVDAKSSSDGLKLAVHQRIELGFQAATIVQNPDKRCLYLAAAKSEEGGTSGAVVKLDQRGGYKEHSLVTFRHGYCYLSLDRTKRWLLGVDYAGGHVDVYALDDQGMPNEGTTSLDEGRRNAHCVIPSPNNRFAYIPYVKDTNAIFQYGFDAQTGSLLPLDPKNAAPPDGTGPRHMAYHPSLDIAYFSNEQLPGASVYHIADSGALRLHQVCRAFDRKQDTSGVSSSDIVITPDGKYLFVGIRGHRRDLDRIGRFRVLPDGSLQLLGLTEADDVPWGMTLSTDSRFLLVSAFRGATLTAYAIGKNGELSIADRLQWDRRISDLVAGP